VIGQRPLIVGVSLRSLFCCPPVPVPVPMPNLSLLLLCHSYCWCCAGAMQSTNLDGAVDGSRVGLWGVSYGGAHVLVTAAKLGSNISAVIANVSGFRVATILYSMRVRGILGTSAWSLPMGVPQWFDAATGLDYCTVCSGGRCSHYSSSSAAVCQQ
jgi:hypothetical protein